MQHMQHLSRLSQQAKHGRDGFQINQQLFIVNLERQHILERLVIQQVLHTQHTVHQLELLEVQQQGLHIVEQAHVHLVTVFQIRIFQQ